GALERCIREGGALRLRAGAPGAPSEALGGLPRLRPPAGPLPRDTFGLRRPLHTPAASAECEQSDRRADRRDAVQDLPEETPRRDGAVPGRVATRETSGRCGL